MGIDGNRAGDDELTLFADDRVAVRSNASTAQPRWRQLTRPPNGHEGGRADERGAHVGAARDGLQMDRWLIAS
jgi:hypothetical protein